jgi:flagellin
MLSIQNNISSLDAQRNLTTNENQLNSVMSQLSSGFRITSAGDDAAGLGISNNLEADIGSYNQASRNASDGLSLVQTAEGSLNETSNILSRLRQLAMESASSGVGNTERGYIQTETTALTTEVDRIANATEYNGTKLLNSAATSLTFQIGIRDVAANDQITVNTVDATASTLGVAGLDLSTQANAQAALATIDTAINAVSGDQSALGATSNRLTDVSATIQSSSENLSAADSRIKDVDVAAATSQMARSNILMQAGISVLAQANQQPQLALKLLQ